MDLIKPKFSVVTSSIPLMGISSGSALTSAIGSLAASGVASAAATASSTGFSPFSTGFTSDLSVFSTLSSVP